MRKVAKLKDARMESGRSGMPPLVGLAPLVVGLILWQIFGNSKSVYAPPPSVWFENLSRVTRNRPLLSAIFETVWSYAIGLGLAVVLGAIIGLAVGSSRFLDRLLGPIIEFMRAIPASAMVPVAVLLIGIDLQMKLAVVAIATCWPVVLNTRTTIRSIDPMLRDCSSSMQLSRVSYVRKIVLPYAALGIFLGARIAAPVTLVITILVEILTVISGLGSLIALAQQAFLAGVVYGLLLIAGAIAIIANLAVTFIERRLAWRFGPSYSA